MRSTRGLRRSRAFNIIVVIIDAGLAVFQLCIGVPTAALFPAIIALGFLLFIRKQSRDIAIREAPHPDYAEIAKMERDIWGQSFRHDGDPRQEWS